MVDFTNGGFLAYVNDCDRQEKISKLIAMFESGMYDIEDDWDRDIATNACGLNDITNEEAKVVLKRLGKM